METPLNSIQPSHWFVDEVRYSEYELEIHISEGITSKETAPEAPVPGAKLVEVTSQSRRYKITFDSVMNFQITDESVATPDRKAEGTDGVLRIYKKSSFLNYVESNCDIWVSDNYRHYCLLTSNEIIDIISAEDPLIEQKGS